jgi:hypothetical protein
MNPQLSRKEEIEKGCQCFLEEDDFQEDDCFEHNIYCGTEVKGKIMLCPTCQARLDERIRAEQDFLKMMKEFIEDILEDVGSYSLTRDKCEAKLRELKSTIKQEKTE